MAAADRGGGVEVPLALLVNQPISRFEKCIFILYKSSMAYQLLSHPKIYIFCSFSLNLHSGYTRLGRHYSFEESLLI